VVLSLTCYSAPFDHPTADSIGEKLLRLDGKGAISVFAASWRNSPSRSFSEAILDEISVPGTPVGEALMRAKQSTRSRTLVETYNLLGDPAVSLALPSGRVTLGLVERDEATVVEGTVDQPGFDGEGLVEWVDVNLEVVHSESVVAADSSFDVVVEGESRQLIADAVGVRVWMWDPTTDRDAMGWHGLKVEDTEPDGEATGASTNPRRTAKAAADESKGEGQ
jgi:hypothetical protein